MAEDKKQNQEAQEPEEGEQTQAKKSGLIKYALFGVIGLVAVLGIAFGTLMLLGGSEETAGKPDQASEAVAEGSEAHGDVSHDDATAGEEHAEEASAIHDDLAEQKRIEDSIMNAMEHDSGFLAEVMASLEVLDYDPEEDMTDTDGTKPMTAEDSIEAVNWLESEKTRLAEWEKKLNAREKSLNVLDSKVQQKILRIEQAESLRIAKLAKLYDGMDAQSVARLVANLDDETVVALLPRMKLKNASSVLALMPPVRAARLSKQMITIAEN